VTEQDAFLGALALAFVLSGCSHRDKDQARPSWAAPRLLIHVDRDVKPDTALKLVKVTEQQAVWIEGYTWRQLPWLEFHWRTGKVCRNNSGCAWSKDGPVEAWVGAPDVAAHEFFHVYLWNARGDPDRAHEDARWRRVDREGWLIVQDWERDHG